jgi:hypothetical protein
MRCDYDQHFLTACLTALESPNLFNSVNRSWSAGSWGNRLKRESDHVHKEVATSQLYPAEIRKNDIRFNDVNISFQD